MEVKQAIEAAKLYVNGVYSASSEAISNIGLEEIEYNDAERHWMITLAFSRPWDTPKTRAGEILEKMGSSPPALKRSYKTVTVDDDNGRILSMKNRSRSDD